MVRTIRCALFFAPDLEFTSRRIITEATVTLHRCTLVVTLPIIVTDTQRYQAPWRRQHDILAGLLLISRFVDSLLSTFSPLLTYLRRQCQGKWKNVTSILAKRLQSYDLS